MAAQRRSTAAPRPNPLLAGLEEDQPQRFHVGAAVRQSAYHCDLPADILVGAAAAGDPDRERLVEGGLAAELDLTVLEHERAVTQRVQLANGAMVDDTGRP